MKMPAASFTASFDPQRPFNLMSLNKHAWVGCCTAVAQESAWSLACKSKAQQKAVIAMLCTPNNSQKKQNPDDFFNNVCPSECV